MGRIITTDQGEIEIEDEEEPTQAEQEAAELVDGLIAGFGGDEEVVVYLYRLHTNKDRAYISQMSASEFSLDMLRDEHGGGRFQIIIKKGSKAVKSRRISVEPPKKQEQALTVPGQDNSQSLFMEMMRTNENRMFELVRTIAGKDTPEKPKYNLVELINAAAVALPMVKELLGGNSSSKDQMDLFMKALQLGQEMSGNKPETTMTEVMLKGIESLGTLVKNQPQQGQTQQNQTGEPTSQPAQLTQENVGEQVMFNLMKSKLAPLVEAAKNNEDPSIYVDIIYSKVPDNYIREWVINEQNPIEKLSKIEPEVSNHKSWFEALIGYIREDYRESDKESETESEKEPQD
jgi:hypothetical protein